MSGVHDLQSAGKKWVKLNIKPSSPEAVIISTLSASFVDHVVWTSLLHPYTLI